MLDGILERISRDNIPFEILDWDPGSDYILEGEHSSDTVYVHGWNIIAGYIGTSNIELTWKILDTIERLQLSDHTHGLIMGAFALDRAHICTLLDGQGCANFMIQILLLQVLAKLATTKAATKIMLDQELHCFLTRLVLNPQGLTQISGWRFATTIPQCAILRVLQNICAFPESAEDIAFRSKTLDVAAEFLHSSSVTVRSGACYLLAAIARHKKGCLAILDRKLTGSLLQMMRSS
ncbi:hypothetical protein R3P38DRAFT_714526 [Favolaschia claudopus]|uniref:Uncharacterized protein n=1 Tax=Favolaschia claudopus TaxID=2862362 RepID=A0AAV9Z5W2_9AGAR